MRRPILGALAVGGLAIGLVVAMLGWAPRAHEPSGADWVVQAAVLLAAGFLLVARATGKR